MKFKKFKYNIICLVMVLLIATAVVIKVGFYSAPAPDSNISFDQEAPETNDGRNESGGSTSSSNSTDTTGDEDFQSASSDNEIDTDIPSKRFPINRLNYCIDKTTSSLGYQASINYSSAFSVPSLNKSAVVMATGKIYRYKDGDKYIQYEDMKFVPDELIQALKVVPFYHLQATYHDGTNIHRWRTPEGDVSSYNNANYTFFENGVGARMFYDLLNPVPVFTPSAASVGIIDNGSVDIINVTMTKKSGFPASFLRTYQSYSEYVNIKEITQSIEFTINSQTGFIKKFTLKQCFHGSYSGIAVDININYTQTFTKMNQKVSFTLPQLPQ